MTRKITLAATVALCLGALVLATAIPASAQTTQRWPKPGVEYNCNGPDILFTTISGNNYYRWGYTTVERVTFVRKANNYPSWTRYEYTTHSGLQCDMEVYNGYFFLSGCNDGVFRFCSGETMVQTGP